MRDVGENLAHPRSGDPLPLFDRKRVVGRLQLDIRPDPVIAEMDAGLEVFRARIERQFGG